MRLQRDKVLELESAAAAAEEKFSAAEVTFNSVDLRERITDIEAELEEARVEGDDASVYRLNVERLEAELLERDAALAAAAAQWDLAKAALEGELAEERSQRAAAVASLTESRAEIFAQFTLLQASIEQKVGLSLPGVRLRTWVILAVMKWCSDCKVM